MSINDRKALLVVSILRTIAEIKQDDEGLKKAVELLNGVLDAYSGTLSEIELKKIELSVSAIFKEMISRKFLVNEQVVYAMMIISCEEMLSKVRNEQKIEAWQAVDKYACSMAADDKVELIEAAQEVTEFMFDSIKKRFDPHAYISYGKKQTIKEM